MKKIIHLLILTFAIKTSSLFAADSPILKFDSSGNAIAVWQEPVSGNFSKIQAAQYTVSPSPAWSSPVDISDTGVESSLPSLAMNSTGDAAAVWYGINGSVYSLYVSTIASGTTTWSTVTKVSTTLNGSEETVNQINIQVLENGDLVANWTGIDNLGDSYIRVGTSSIGSPTSWSVVTVGGP